MNKHAEERNPVEVLGEEFLQRRRHGELVTTLQYMESYPDLAEEIGLQFPVMVALERFRSSSLSSSGDHQELHFEPVHELGDYRIISEIGRGAMGVVYEAEQRSLRRRVAVKVFPRQMLQEPHRLERFRREAQTAASLHHTNIVPVFGVGQHEGLHYFVMQRIDGVALDELDRHVTASQPHSVVDETHQQNLATDSTRDDGNVSDPTPAEPFHIAPAKAVLELDDVTQDHLDADKPAKFTANYRTLANIGIQVAEALHYAHSQGVLHRDIKPGNLILDPNGTVWVADFGLATVLQADDRSGAGEVVGTLRFMTPEQLGGQYDARSDIYSLGATLYDLLTDQPAFQAESRVQLIDRILNGEFAAPRKIRPGIPRDLEAIVLKAMAREPADRYQGAADLATDLQRFIDGRPVSARPIGVVDRSIRWTWRNPIVAALCGLLLVVAVSSFYLVSSKWQEAVAERSRAEGNLSLALESMDQILNRFTSSWMAHPVDAKSDAVDESTTSIGFQMVVSDHSVKLMQDALSFYDRFAAENAANPRLQRDTAKVYRRVGDIYQRLGQYQQAEQAYRRSLTILQQFVATDASLVLEQARTLNELGLALYATSQFSAAKSEFLNARNLLNEAACRDDTDCQAVLATTNYNLGQAQWLMLRFDEATQSLGRAVAILEDLVKQQPDEVDYQLSLARAYRASYSLTAGRRVGESDEIQSAGIAILEKLVQDYPNVPDYQCELSETLTARIFNARRPQSNHPHSERIQRGLGVAEQLTQSHPLIPRYRVAHARALNVMAATLSKSNPDEAMQHLTDSIKIYRSLSQDFPDIPAYRIFLAMALRDDAQRLREMNLLDQSRASAEAGVKEQQIYVRLRPDNSFGNSILSRLYDELAKTLTALNATEEAEQARAEAQQLRQGWSNRARSHAN